MEDITNDVPGMDMLRNSMDEYGYSGCPIKVDYSPGKDVIIITVSGKGRTECWSAFYYYYHTLGYLKFHDPNMECLNKVIYDWVSHYM